MIWLLVCAPLMLLAVVIAALPLVLVSLREHRLAAGALAPPSGGELDQAGTAGPDSEEAA